MVEKRTTINVKKAKSGYFAWYLFGILRFLIGNVWQEVKNYKMWCFLYLIIYLCSTIRITLYLL